MQDEQTPQDTPTEAPQAAPPSPTAGPSPSFWRKYRWFIVALVVLAGAGLAFLLTRHSNKPVAQSPYVSLPSKNTTQTTDNTNSWKSTVSTAAIPLGDGHLSSTPKAGYIDSCTTNFRSGGARHSGSWIDSAANTWDSKTKVAVQGSVLWPTASYSQSTSGSNRILTTNDLPKTYPTGTFPISRSDPAYAYDTNPNSIGLQSLSYSVPLNPTAAATPNCLPLGAIGVMSDGVLLFNGLDDAGRDAVAHETQDLCNGHPDGQEMYHYHDVPSCILNKATGASTLVGYALDGYGIYVERDSKGNLPTNADLDACHGRTSQVTWNGKTATVYHYDATYEYPYTLGCYHGTAATKTRRR